VHDVYTPSPAHAELNLYKPPPPTTHLSVFHQHSYTVHISQNEYQVLQNHLVKSSNKILSLVRKKRPYATLSAPFPFQEEIEENTINEALESERGLDAMIISLEPHHLPS
ncbi:Uncharacterized protein FKW44_023198, partial [Caligus rogercresseyi]